MASKTTTTSTPNNLTSSKTGTFYFAFGSNLSAFQMSKRLQHSPSSSAPVAIARLDKYKWIICERGYANVVPVARTANSNATANGCNDVVWGVLYNMSSEDEATLDLYEGHNEARNPEPTANPEVEGRVCKPYLQGEWDYNKLYLTMTITRWLRDPREYGVDADMAVQSEVRALVYVDEDRMGDGEIAAGYTGRMNRGIREAVRLGLDEDWVGRVVRRWVVEGVEVDDYQDVGTDEGYKEGEEKSGNGRGWEDDKGAIVDEVVG